MGGRSARDVRQGPDQGGAGGRTGGQGAGDRRGVEPRVGQGQPQRVPVAAEAAVHHGHPVAGRNRFEPGRDGVRRVSLDDLEPQRPQVVGQR